MEQPTLFDTPEPAPVCQRCGGREQVWSDSADRLVACPVCTKPAAHARTSDPVTSHEAAASLSPTDLRESQQNVLAAFHVVPRMHDEMLSRQYAALGLPHQSVSGLRTRRKELVTLGWLRDSGDRVTLPESGRHSIVWELVRRLPDVPL